MRNYKPIEKNGICAQCKRLVSRETMRALSMTRGRASRLACPQCYAAVRAARAEHPAMAM